MDPVALVVAALSAGTVAAVKDGATDAVKTAYRALRDRITAHYPTASVTQLEQSPSSAHRRAVVAEDLRNEGADHDEDLLNVARALLTVLKADDPEAARVVGVELRDVTSESLQISDVVAHGSGAVGVRLESVDIAGGIALSGVLAEEDHSSKKA